MVGIIGIIALLTVPGLSLAITRLATIALAMTGLSREAASFQARSAFTGTGFTTTESEKIVNHPVRRRIIVMLMVLRSAGLVTIVLSLILSFVGATHDVELLFRLLWLVGGVALLIGLAHLPILERGLEHLIRWALSRWTDLDVRDYASLLDLSGDYAVREVSVNEQDWVEDKELQECDLAQEGVIVLGIQRSDGGYVGAPRASTKIHAGDTLVLYGRSDTLRDLDDRAGGSAGDAAHRSAVDDEQQRMRQQDRQEREYERKREAEDGEDGPQNVA